EGIEYLKTAIAEVTKDLDVERYILANLIEPGDTVLLVMPQDIQAPRGRLILPQVQTIRELLDRSCTTVCTTADNFAMALSALAAPPNLIVTDSQCFGEVYKGKPAASKLTSFSVLFAAYKGDMKEFEKGAYVIDRLSNDGKVLIAEACTHAPLTEDIGREKIPALLKKRYPNITVDIVSGAKFPKNLGDYDLIIHCGACMFNRKLVLSRIKAAKDAGVAITNYGIVMAYFAEILDKIDIPE
ncbi:MAG: [FeFe] hydrogenase H-cluster maturation GTPase HydF, partial [Anaerovoracaceae bacterium]